MSFLSRSRSLAGCAAVALLAACESPPDVQTDNPCGATFPAPPEGSGEVLYVAAQCQEAEATGTEAHPFVRISDALEEAGEGATIVVSGGEYAENLTITRAVTIVGSSSLSSPGDTTLSLKAPDDNAVVVQSAGVALIGLRIEGARGTGVLVDGGEATLSGSIVSDTQTGSDGLAATGVLVRGGGVKVNSTWVTGTAGTGILVLEAGATVSDSEVRDSLGPGIHVERAISEVAISSTTLSGNAGSGVRSRGSTVVIDDSSITGTLVAGSTDDGTAAADGVLSYDAQDAEGNVLSPANLTVRGSTISGNGRAGILCGSGTRAVVIQDSTISDNGLPGTSVFKYVAGIWLQSGTGDDPVSEISGNTVSGNRLAGIFLFGGTYSIPVTGNTVTGTLLEITYGVSIGDGIGLAGGASARLDGNVVTGSARFGIMIDGASPTSTEVTGNTIQNSAEYGIVLQGLDGQIPVGTNTFTGNASGDTAEVPGGTYGNPDRPLPL